MVHRMVTRRTAVPAMIAATLVLAACGGGSKQASKVASLNGSGATTTTVSKVDMQTAALNYAKCMRAHGVDMPDPTFDATTGRPQFFRTGQGPGGSTPNGGGGTNPQTFRRDDPKFQAAQQACQKYRDEAFANFQLTPAQIAERQKNLLAFAKCMRSHGVNFPDPQFDSNGRPQFQQGTGQGFRSLRDDPSAQKAFQACQQQLGNSFRIGFGGPGRGAPTP